jgi:hypothetical protein
LGVCWCGAPSLTRGGDCNLQLLLGLVSADFVESVTRDSWSYSCCLWFETLETWKARFLYLLSPRVRVAELYPQALGLIPRRLSSENQSYLTTCGQLVSLSWCQATIRAHVQFFFPLEILFRQLGVCYNVSPSLTRGRVFNLLLLLCLASAVPLGSESHGVQDHILLPQSFRLPQPGGPDPRIYISQEQGGPVPRVQGPQRKLYGIQLLILLLLGLLLLLYLIVAVVRICCVASSELSSIMSLSLSGNGLFLIDVIACLTVVV